MTPVLNDDKIVSYSDGAQIKIVMIHYLTILQNLIQELLDIFLRILERLDIIMCVQISFYAGFPPTFLTTCQKIEP